VFVAERFRFLAAYFFLNRCRNIISATGLVATSAVAALLHISGINAAWASNPDCPATVVAKRQISGLGTIDVWQLQDAYGFTSHLHVNADGAPNAYTPANDGLSFLCDGAVAFKNGQCVYPSQSTEQTWQPLCRDAWRTALAENFEGPKRLCIFGMLTDDRERPLRQGQDDPIPGAFISTTSLIVSGAPAGTQRRYVDSTEIPFVVLPRALARQIGVDLGDVAFVRRGANGAMAAAVFADIGPTWGLGEGSIALHRALENEPIRPYRGGVPRAKFGIAQRDVTIVIFPNSVVPTDPDTGRWREAIKKVAHARLEAWGGQEQLAACADFRS
jgi:hypothetical protein